MRRLTLLVLASLAIPSAPALAQPAARVKDLNTEPGYGSSPRGFAALNGVVYFQAADPAHGAELWRTDGTAAGTRLLRDVVPGPRGSDPAGLVAVGSRIFFTADQLLWQTDGTTAGTVRISTNLNVPNGYLPMGDTLFFGANDGVHGVELWRTDGTPQGTALVKDINPGTSSAYPTPVAVLGSTLYLLVHGPQGYELWKSDGTDAGTVPVYVFEPASFIPAPGPFVPVGGVLYFGASTLAAGRELWLTDGTTAGTRMVKDIRQGPDDGAVYSFTAVGSTLYFSANDGFSGEELWKTNGTAAGTVRVRDIVPGFAGSQPGRFQHFEGLLYFVADDGVNGPELWRSDGTEAGTTLFAVVSIDPYGPIELAVHDGALYFTATGAVGRELYRTDGGPPVVLDLVPGTDGSRPQSLASAGGSLYFAASGPGSGPQHNGEPWRSDGTVAGSVEVKALGAAGSSTIRFGAVLPDAIVFATSDTIAGFEPWRSDGTEAGTYRLADLFPGPDGSTGGEFAVLGGVAYFFARDAVGDGLFRTDGTVAGTGLVTRAIGTNAWNLVASDNLLYFVADNGFLNNELWRSDGTAAGTMVVKDIHPGAGSFPLELTPAGNLLYFLAKIFPDSYELWKTDGSEAGTVVLSDISSGPPGGVRGLLTPVAGGTVFFSANDGVHGAELWKTDGTFAGTVLVKDINPGPEGSDHFRSVAVGAGVYIVADEPEHGAELWHSDGTEAGTRLVRDIRPGPLSSNIYTLRRTDDALFFSATDGVTGDEPWRTDGTPEGTYALGDLWPGPESSTYGFDVAAAEWGGWVFFTATTPATGQELWRTDGTSAGTTLVYEIGPGVVSAGIVTHPVPAAGQLFFQAADDAGSELWAMRPELRIADQSVSEGAPAAGVVASLIPRLDRPVTASFATADGTAFAGADYVAAAGVVTFPPGVASRTVNVALVADGLDEADETFHLDLSNAAGAFVAVPRADVLIVDDDPTPLLGVADVAVMEGGPGDTTAQVTISTVGASSFPVTVSFATADGTALAGSDYASASGTVTFPPGATTAIVPVTITGDVVDEPDERFFVALSNPSQAVLGDALGLVVIGDDDGVTLRLSALDHATDRVATLAASGPAADQDLYLLLREPFSSYEVLVDGASADLGDAGPTLERVAADLATVLQSSSAVGTGTARSLRIENDTALPVVDYVRVRSAGCGSDCGPDDTYRIRVRETTGRVTRFNEAGGQRTVLILQNTTGAPLAAHVAYWSTSGALLDRQAVTLPPRGLSVTPTPAAAAGLSGSITVSHDAPYGALVGKAVAVDGNGLAFDTPLVPRSR